MSRQHFENVVIISHGHAAEADASALQDEPQFRKATMPMLLAWQAAQNAMRALPEALRDDVVRWGLVVGVDHGELEVTKEFLCTIEERGLARPFLFQSSLHNATLGFLSIHLGIKGPGLTTCTHHFSGEDALTLAADLVASGDCDVCLCVGVEAIDTDMRPAVEHLQGAGCDVVSSSGALVLARHGKAAGPTLTSIECVRAPSDARPQPRACYGAEAVEYVARACTDGLESVELVKPNGGRSRIVLGKQGPS